MTTHTNSATVFDALFRGAGSSAGPVLAPIPGTLDRPEGTRRYLVASPPARAGTRRPLVIVLHGGGASAEQVMGLTFPPSPLSLWLEIAARENLVVMAPDGDRGSWSDWFASSARVAARDDVAFIDALIDVAIREHGVDADRVYLMGVSRGGWMAYRAASEIPHRLAAFSVVLAGMPQPTGPRARASTTPLPVLVFGCTDDPLIRYRGGKHWYMPPFMKAMRGIEDTVRFWRELAGLPDTPEVVRIAHQGTDSTSATRYLWGSNARGLQVGLVRIDGGGHAEPSARRRYPLFINWLTGLQSADVETAEAAWDFFREKRAHHAGRAATAVTDAPSLHVDEGNCTA